MIPANIQFQIEKGKIIKLHKIRKIFVTRSNVKKVLQVCFESLRCDESHRYGKSIVSTEKPIKLHSQKFDCYSV